ncbi:MAG: hypothetical protein ACKVQR_13895 [Aquabacterium sp.]
MENAEVYMLLLRKTTLAPVFGESIELGPFFGQIVLDGWDYKLTHEDRINEQMERERLRNPRAMTRRAMAYMREGTPEGLIKCAELLEGVERIRQGNTEALQTQLNDAAAASADDAPANSAEASERASEENMEFNFSKTLCTGTTQMLNMMKGGVPFQSAVITVVHRAGIWSKVPGFLTIMLTNLMLTKYQLEVSQDESNTELKEQWTGKFTHLTFKYFRRLDAPYGNVAQKIHQAAMTAQGGVVFIMKPRLTSL